ncbi:hypothetical protein FAES_3205 [Fibrella aestuarina BUZ 2]|uniref:Uncharacterized protein n=1 Tax=Fibrella aestuarina BUZ 2 TaxID=1166018 RepID=I0KAR1_9BACT|nr:hypothetical protein [Fibrella aestuarina]CCH01214.1 hypothetical protein FAES_3205 [Fibrella aestuarina BUZ 2]
MNEQTASNLATPYTGVQQETTKPDLRTAYVIEREERELKIYKRYQELIAQPGAMMTPVVDQLCREFNIHSRTTIYQLRSRVAKRLDDAAAETPSLQS